jgi:outer membrane protein assembly factor BamB
MSLLDDLLKRILPQRRPAPPPTGMKRLRSLAHKRWTQLKRAVRDVWRTARKDPRSLWKNHKRELLVAAGVVVAAIALIGYLSVKRPGDILNKNAEFDPFEQKLTRGVVDWPTYGFNNDKVRYLPRKGLRPPLKRRWEYVSGALMEFSPILVRGRILGLNNAGLAFSLDSKTGKLNWDHDIGSLNASSPAFDDGRLFMVNLEPQQVLALDADTGKEIWKKDLPGRSESSPAVADGMVIFGCENGDLFALDEATGKEIWHRDVGSAIKGGPAISDGVAYVGDYGGSLTAVNIDDGSVKWSSSGQGQSFGRAGSFYATPAVAFGRVYIGSKDGRMYSFEADTGKIAWSHTTGGEIYASVAVADTPATPPSVYFGGLDGKVYALNAQDGSEEWVKQAGGSVIGAGSVLGQVFYVSNVSKRATAGFATSSGKRVFGDDFGAYNSAISDGKQIYFNTYAGVIAMKYRPGGGLTKEQKQAAAKAAEQQGKSGGKGGGKD